MLATIFSFLDSDSFLIFCLVAPPIYLAYCIGWTRGINSVSED